MWTDNAAPSLPYAKSNDSTEPSDEKDNREEVQKENLKSNSTNNGCNILLLNNCCIN